MLTNYFKVAWRHIYRHRLYAAVNVAGLALGFAVALLILLFVHDEWTRDAFHEEEDRIYRVVGREAGGGGTTWAAKLDGPVGPLLEENLPQVEHAARVNLQTRQVVHDEQPVEQEVLFVDPAFLEMFTFPLIAGSFSALDAPDTVVLTEEAARRFFGSTHPLGQTLDVEFRDEVRALTVAGVVENVPRTSSLQFDLLVPIEMMAYTAHPMLGAEVLTRWRMRAADTYVQLEAEADAEQAASLIDQIIANHRDDYSTAFTNAAEIDSFALQPLSKVYLSADIDSDAAASSRPLYGYVLMGIGALVLFLACINFTALAVGRSAERAKEVGVRKAAGARPNQIRRQFWSEALLTTVLAVLVGLALAALALPSFNALAGKALTLTPLADPRLLALVAGGILIISLLAAAYPAWILARLRPTEVLRGRVGSRHQHRLIQGLVVVQFALSLALLIGALGMFSQLRYIQDVDLGFDHEQILVIRNRTDIDTPDLIARLRQELRPYPSVQQVSGAGELFGEAGIPFTVTVGDSISAQINEQTVGEHYREVMGLKLLAGYDLPGNDSQTGGALVNEAFLRALRWTPEDALGTSLELEAGNATWLTGEIFGVVEDYHYESLHHAVEPLMLSLGGASGGLGYALVRISGDGVAHSLRRIEAAWQSVAPGEPFPYRFLDDDVQAQYETDRRWAAIVRWAVALALLISCFGLFAMSALVTARRTKEIGIRKALGASTSSMVALLSKDFVKLVLIAFVIAAPVAYFTIQRWLQGFAYRINLGAGIFLVAGALALAVALATISYQTIKEALSDPVETLRRE